MTGDTLRGLGHGSEPVRFEMLVDGHLGAAAGGAVFESDNPYTRRPWAELSAAAPGDVDEAVSAARRVADSGVWAGQTPRERGRVLIDLAALVEEHADVLARLETLDTGKLHRQNLSQVRFAAATLRYYGELADKVDGRVVPVADRHTLDLTVHEPLGVCALLTAWNSPLQLLANKLAPALAAGNTVVVRPSELAPASTAYLASLIPRVGIAAGVVNVVTGADTESARQLVRHPGVDCISLTGGSSTGRDVAATAGSDLKRVIMELGGKSAHIVFDDADAASAVDGIVAGVFPMGGQTCVAGSRVLVQKGRYQEIVERVVQRAEAMVLGDPFDPSTDMGPMANEQQYGRVTSHVEAGIRQGARLLTGGPQRPRPDGLFVPPTVFVDVDPSMSIAQEEVFGPVVAVMPFADEDEAVAIANGTSYDLAAGVWTSNLDRALRMVHRLRAGTVWVNTYRQVDVAAPFGGMRRSGRGRERGIDGLLEYQQVKNAMVRIAPLTVSVRSQEPPFASS